MIYDCSEMLRFEPRKKYYLSFFPHPQNSTQHSLRIITYCYIYENISLILSIGNTVFSYRGHILFPSLYTACLILIIYTIYYFPYVLPRIFVSYILLAFHCVVWNVSFKVTI